MIMQNIGNSKQCWYRKQTPLTAIREHDNHIAVIYPKEFITTVGNGVPCQPLINIQGNKTKVVLLESKHHHWQELTMAEAKLYVEINNLSPMTLAHPVRGTTK